MSNTYFEASCLSNKSRNKSVSIIYYLTWTWFGCVFELTIIFFTEQYNYRELRYQFDYPSLCIKYNHILKKTPKIVGRFLLKLISKDWSIQTLYMQLFEV